jgi:hypothetical protein
MPARDLFAVRNKGAEKWPKKGDSQSTRERGPLLCMLILSFLLSSSTPQSHDEREKFSEESEAAKKDALGVTFFF